MRGHVGGGRDLVLVADHQHAVLGGHEIGLDVIGALAGAELVGRQGVSGR